MKNLLLALLLIPHFAFAQSPIGSNQTSLDIQARFSDSSVLTAPLSLSITSDSDASVVRQHSDPVDIARGVIGDFTRDHKFGRNNLVGTTYEPITSDGIFRSPQVSGATTLRVRAGNANDTAAGTGAREVTDFPRGQSQICAYSVPVGQTAYILDYRITSDSNKAIDVSLFKRENILETAPPYTPMRLIEEFTGVQGFIDHESSIPFGPFPELTDLGFMAKAVSSADVSCDFEILLIED